MINVESHNIGTASTRMTVYILTMFSLLTDWYQYLLWDIGQVLHLTAYFTPNINFGPTALTVFDRSALYVDFHNTLGYILTTFPSLLVF